MILIKSDTCDPEEVKRLDTPGSQVLKESETRLLGKLENEEVENSGTVCMRSQEPGTTEEISFQ